MTVILANMGKNQHHNKKQKAKTRPTSRDEAHTQQKY
jgi:hypothetical protein